VSASGLPVAPEALLRRLEWHIVRRLDGQLQGEYRTLLHGSGIDVAELREYEPGDDVRHIDWNVTARMDTPYVRTFLEDRDVASWLLLDRSASMSFGPVDRPKELVQVELAATLSRVLGRAGNPVGAMLWNNGMEARIEPRTGRTQTLRITKALLNPSSPVGASNNAAPPQASRMNRFRRSGRGVGSTATRNGTTQLNRRTDLAELFRVAAQTIRRRSLIVVVSDFISEPGWEQSLSMLNRRHEVVAIRLVDQRESDLPDAGLIVVQDVETGELLSVDTSDPVFRQRLQQVAVARDQEVRALAKHAHVELHEVSTRDDLVAFLVKVAHRRKQRRT
jgi:uncharacterized protein (DUF58 family)